MIRDQIFKKKEQEKGIKRGLTPDETITNAVRMLRAEEKVL